MAAQDLLSMIMSAQNGKAVTAIGRTQGLKKADTVQAITALLPALSSALKQNTQKPEGLAALLGALQTGNHDKYLDDPALYKSEDTINDGNAILGHLFGSKDVSRAVASRAAQETGIGSDVLKKLLPLVATMAMGSLSKQTKEQSVAQQLAGLALGGSQPRQQSGGMLGSILGAVMGGGQRKQQKQAHQQGLGLLGSMLDADGDGSLMDDVIKLAMKR